MTSFWLSVGRGFHLCGCSGMCTTVARDCQQVHSRVVEVMHCKAVVAVCAPHGNYLTMYQS